MVGCRPMLALRWPSILTVLLLPLGVVGCPEPKTPDRIEPVGDPAAVDLPGEPPEPEPSEPPPEAGRVKLGVAMMVGGRGMSDPATEAATKSFISAFEQGNFLFRRCYAPGLAKDAALAGSVDVRVIVGRDGKLVELKAVSTELADASVADCMVEAFKKLQYAPLQDGELYTVTAPLKLTPE